MQYLFAILGVAAGCTAFGLFQVWMSKKEPECRLRAGCCGGKHCSHESGQPNERGGIDL